VSTYPNKATGGCMCGAVRYQAEGAPLSVIYCHCESCRKHAASPVVALAGYRQDQVTFTQGERKIFASSPGVGRAFCGDCGTPMTWEGDGGDDGARIEFLINTLDNPQDFAPTYHLHPGERIGWFETTGKLPRYRVWNDDGDAPYLNAPAREI